MKCDTCGKFTKENDLIHVCGEYEETWTECVRCTSQYELDKLKEKGDE